MKTQTLLVAALLCFVFWSCKKTDTASQTPSQTSTINGVQSAGAEILHIKNGKNDFYVEQETDHYRLEGDILLSEEQLQFLKNGPRGNARAVTTELFKLWPSGVVPYTIAFSASGITSQIQQAMQEWAAYTPVKFVPRTSSHADYVEFIGTADENSSYIGRQGGKQIIRLTASSNLQASTAVHEIGHAIGMFHEQSRADRDNYINVNWSNIKPDKVHNYKNYIETGEAGIDLGTFDFYSIMLYGSKTSDTNFVYNTAIPVMTKKDGSLFYSNFYLSSGDIDAAKYLYAPAFYVSIENHDTELPSTNGDEMIIGNAYASLYSDRACTIPTTSPFPIKVNCVIEENISGTQTYYKTVTIPPNTQSAAILLAYNKVIKIYDGANLYRNETIYVNVRAGVGYKLYNQQ